MSDTIYLLRHGQTQFNAEQRLQGHCDSRLTKLGEQQAHAMGATLREAIGAGQDYTVLVSPLGRAQQTAQRVCEELGVANSEIRTDPRLIEVAFGAWEMLKVHELHAAQPHLVGLKDWYFHSPDGEKFADVVARIQDFLADPTLPAKKIVVAHGLFGRIFRGVYAQLQADALWAQDMPQDAFFRLQAGQIQRIECLQFAD